jgi:hypothetical protein
VKRAKRNNEQRKQQNQTVNVTNQPCEQQRACATAKRGTAKKRKNVNAQRGKTQNVQNAKRKRNQRPQTVNNAKRNKRKRRNQTRKRPVSR